MKKALKSKTIWFAICIAIISVLQGFVLELPFEPKYQAMVGVILAVAVTILRCLTTAPLDDK